MSIKVVRSDMEYERLPERLRVGVQRYIEDGYLPGDFLFAVITNNLLMAVGRADSDMIKVLPEITTWFYSYPPSPCWGSEKALENWTEMHENGEVEVIP